MTKKDYVGIAAAIAERLQEANLEMCEDLCITETAHSIANYCERENPSGFNRELFLINCGINEPTKEHTK